MRNKIWYAGLFLLALSIESHGQVWKEKYLQSQEAYLKESYDQAFVLADESLKSYLAESGAMGESYAAILRLLSSISYSQQKLQQGIEFIEKELLVRADKKDTIFAVALANKALFEQELGKYEKAIETLLACRQVLTQYFKEDDPSMIACGLKLGINYYFIRDFDKAKEWLVPSLSFMEKSSAYTEEGLEAFYYLGMLYLEVGDRASALNTFLKTDQLYVAADLTQTLSYPMVLFGLARAHEKNGAFAKAEDSYKKAQVDYEKLAGKEGESYYEILGARLINLVHLDKLSEAEGILMQMRNKPEGKQASAKAAASMASLLFERADYAKAEAYYRQALAAFDQSNNQSALEYAETNLNLATLLSIRGGVTEAQSRIEESRSIIQAKRGTQNELYLTVLVKVGIVQIQAGDFLKAEATFGEAKKLLAKLPAKPEREVVLMTSGLAEIELQKGNYAIADSLYQTVIYPYNSASKNKDIYYAQALNNLAAVRQRQGRLTESLEIVKESATTTRMLLGNMSLAYGIALENMGLLRLSVGDLSASKFDLDSALFIYEKTLGKESVEFANGMMSLGRYHQVTGDYTKAEPYLKGAREVIKKQAGDQSPSYAGVLNNLALLYQTLGNYRDAEILLKEAQSIIEKTLGKLNEEYATAIQNLATLYQLQTAYDKAEPLLIEAMEIDRKVLGENHPHFSVSQQNLATLYQKLGKRDQAQVMLERVLASTEQRFGKKHPSYITTLSNLAALYQDQRNFPLAESTWKQSIDLRRQVLGEDHPDYARSLYGLAGVYHAQGQWKEAKVYYEPVVEKYQKQVVEFFPALSEKEKSAFYAKIKPVFDAYQDFCVQYLNANPSDRVGTIEKLYNLQLSTKAILLTAASKVRSRILASGDTQLKELFRDWLRTKEEIVRYYNASQEERARYTFDLPSLEAQANDLEKKLSTKSDAFRSQYEKESITWKDVRNALLDGEAAVEILRIKKKYAADSVYYVGLILQKTNPAPEMILWNWGTQLEGRKFKYHRNTIRFHILDTISYSYYWKPLQEKLNMGSTVFLSCDGVFNKVNFNSLFEPVTHRFVIDNYRIRQLSNTSELLERSNNSKLIENTAFLFGFADFNLGAKDLVSHSSKGSLARSLGFDGENIPVLPATEKEVDEIQKLLLGGQWDVKNYKRLEATEENIKKSENPKLIHIATHGFFLSDLNLDDTEASELTSNPLFRSGVLLAGAAVDRETSKSMEDGVLTAYEAMNLNLDETELVVLSACETGLGEVRNGEGVYGLQRSFIVAGAKNVLMSLWQVDDVATQELMNAFYSIWLKGADKQEAFREAQLLMKEKYQIPYFWGAFVLIGN